MYIVVVVGGEFVVLVDGQVQWFQLFVYGGDIGIGLVVGMVVLFYCGVFGGYVKGVLVYWMQYVEVLCVFELCYYIVYCVVVYMVYMDVF